MIARKVLLGSRRDNCTQLVWTQTQAEAHAFGIDAAAAATSKCFAHPVACPRTSTGALKPDCLSSVTHQQRLHEATHAPAGTGSRGLASRTDRRCRHGTKCGMATDMRPSLGARGRPGDPPVAGVPSVARRRAQRADEAAAGRGALGRPRGHGGHAGVSRRALVVRGP